MLARWRSRETETDRPRTAQSFLVPKADIVAQNYDLSINRYKVAEYEEVVYDQPHVILRQLNELENAIREDMRELKARIQSAQIRAALAVNRELVTLYWQTGRDILARQQQQGWGAKVIERLARDLRAAIRPRPRPFERPVQLRLPHLFYGRTIRTPPTAPESPRNSPRRKCRRRGNR